ncbi:MAG TPA: PAS domain S-box protein [Candidatus Acidoferrales bacterium]|nr:PAS domain S-box protein [Candidatus Acidoferrales bacterium]
MFPSSTFSRIALAVTVLLAAVLCLAVMAVPAPAESHLASELVQSLILLWAACCSFAAARQSSGYFRQLWGLLAAALALATAGHLLVFYYGGVLHAPRSAPWPSDVLLFVWVAPAAMTLLPWRLEKSGLARWERILDFAQIGIVFVTAYLYFFYVPALWQTQGSRMFIRLMEAVVGRDALLAAGFLLRGVTLPRSSARSFFSRVAGFFLLLGMVEAVVISRLGESPRGSDWADASWAVPFLYIAVVAAWWPPAVDAQAQPPASDHAGWVVSQAFPVAIPLLVILMGSAIAREQITIAALAVACAFACSAARLLLTGQRHRRAAAELRRAEQAAGLSEQMFTKAFQSSPDAMTISTLEEGRYIEVNEGYLRLFGWRRDEVIGKTTTELGVWPDPADREVFRHRLLADGPVRQMELHLRVKSGRVRTFLVSADVIELNGRPCMLAVSDDITDWKEAQEALRVSEARFRTLVQSLDVGVVLFGAEGRIQFANPAALRMARIRLEDALGKLPSELPLSMVREDGTPFTDGARPVQQALATGQPSHDFVQGWQSPGAEETIWIYGNAVPLLAEDGRIAGVVASFSNITDQKKAAEALRQLSGRLLRLQDEERRRLGRDLHDSLAQSVLAVNLSLAQVTQSSPKLEERNRQALAEARSMLQEMSRQIRTLSYLLHPPLLDELGLSSAVKEYAHGLSERSGIRIQVGVSPGFGRLPQETETALFRVVQESLANIQRHSGSATARIQLEERPDRISLEVSDEGTGIPEAKWRKLNQPGARFGVGIAGMRERMAQLGGTLEIASGGTGTTVRASLPVRAEVLDAVARPRGG